MKTAKNSNAGQRRWIGGDDKECGSTAEQKKAKARKTNLTKSFSPRRASSVQAQ
jgi:hypothetical protein